MSPLIITALVAIGVLVVVSLLRKAKDSGLAIRATTLSTYQRAIASGSNTEDSIFGAIQFLRYREPFKGLSDDELRHAARRLGTMDDPTLFTLVVAEVERSQNLDAIRNSDLLEGFIRGANSGAFEPKAATGQGARLRAPNPGLLAIEKELASIFAGDPMGDGSVVGFMQVSERLHGALDRLYSFVESDPTTSAVMDAHGASRADLESLHNSLMAAGCGFVFGRQVSAAAIGEAEPLEFLLLRKKERGGIGDREANALLKLYSQRANS